MARATSSRGPSMYRPLLRRVDFGALRLEDRVGSADLGHLALDDGAKRAFEYPGQNGGDEAQSCAEQEEAHLVHAAEEAADIALEQVAREAGDEPKAQNHRQDLGRRAARDERQTNRREIKLTQCD